MNHHASSRFWAAYDLLPEPVQQLADKNFALLRADPHHPSLHLKSVGRYWSVRVGRDHRAVAVRLEHDLVWFWIGKHAEYDKLLR
ncbi:hypothetical protein GGQ99_000108 [Aminobacter niigataensis]|uniref:mRNA interferase HigB n=1 Tax=Aminobacter niigataensis TaxID=83265 RepID=A0ABR6KV36_9HYPH|nr:hypothetical protein [Aminobacter niigataensis]MBB4648386.1 hypothetical protein [Aminobacter niigataensis]